MSTNGNDTGLPPPTIQGRLGSPQQAAYNDRQQQQLSQANANRALAGGYMRKKGGAITVPQVQTMYTSPGVSPNDINKSTHATSAQGQTNAEFDKQLGGSKRGKRGGNPDWIWGCYSGGKKRKTRTRTNKRKTRRYRKKTRRNKK